MIIDATDAVLGRLAARIAKDLLRGETTVVINSEKIVISGDPKAVLKRFAEKRERTDVYKGPFYPRYPDRLLKRTVRGMLPYKKVRGMLAFRKLRVYIGNPDNLKGKTISKTSDDLRFKYITLEKLCRGLGAKLG